MRAKYRKERWKKLRGYENTYEISSMGRIRRHDILGPAFCADGAMKLVVYKQGGITIPRKNGRVKIVSPINGFEYLYNMDDLMKAHWA